MQQGDLQQVMRLSEEVHPMLQERFVTLEQRLSAFPRGCIVLSRHREVLGYAFAHPINSGEPPPLDTVPDPLTGDVYQFYLHDFVVSRIVRGKGHAAAGIEKLLQIGEAYQTIALISVYGTSRFWAKFGFGMDTPSDPDKLLGYGQDAMFMVRHRAGIVNE